MERGCARRTLQNLYPLDSFVIDGTRAFFEQLVSFDAKIDDLRPFDSLLDKLSHNIVDDVGRSLRIIVAIFEI